MVLASYFLFVNATPWPFIKGFSHSYQMDSWDFPATVKPGTSVRVNMVQKAGILGQDDGGEVSYSVNNSPAQFEIFYHDHKNADPTVRDNFTTLSTLNNPADTSIQLEWRRGNNSPFILASSDTKISTSSKPPKIVSSNPPDDWMHATYDRISCLSLRELAMPGTHDSGMSEFNQGTGLAGPSDTKTQTLKIADQLKYGARWFDIRPVIAGGHWATGHYSWGCLPGAKGAQDCRWRGGNGQSIASIIDQINEFTASHQELIILDLSHGLDTDHFGGDEHNALTQQNWKDLITLLHQINHRVKGLVSTNDLSSLPISRFIAGGPAVVIIIDATASDGNVVDIGDIIKEGFFHRSQLPLYNKYSSSHDQRVMIADQLQKMKNKRQSPQSEMFLLSWTLTHTLGDIIDYGEDANRALIELLWPAMSASTYPNIIDVDAYPKHKDIAALSIAINYHFARRC